MIRIESSTMGSIYTADDGPYDYAAILKLLRKVFVQAARDAKKRRGYYPGVVDPNEFIACPTARQWACVAFGVREVD